MTHRQTEEYSRDTVTERVSKRVAEAEGVDPHELDSPLYEAVDPDALDQLFAPTDTNNRMQGLVIFTYNGYEVTVGGDGHVAISGLQT